MASKILYTDNFEFSTDQLAQAAWVTDASGLELDYMEYATDGAAQAAYVSSDTVEGYGSDILTGGTASARDETVGYEASKACDDDDTTTYWQDDSSVRPGWWKYDLGLGVTKTVTKLRGKPYSPYGANAFTLQGSNNDSDWDTLLTDNFVNSTTWQEFTFANSTAYRYYRVYITSAYNATYIVFYELEMMESDGIPNLQCYSESTIKSQGSYSLKAAAAQTDSLNDTLTKSGLSLDLSGISELKIDFYAERTGTNIQMQIHDSGGQTSTRDIAISSANTWETTTWDISAIADVDKDNIDQIIIKIINADATNTFYVDNFRVEESLQCYSEDTIKVQGDYSLKINAAQTDSLNKTLTKTITDYLDYSIQDVIKFDIRASRTGSNIKLKIHDIGEDTQEHTINIASANEWQTETWDITGITGTKRDQIDKIIIEISNADSANTIYIDNLYTKVIVETAYTWMGG